MAWQTSKMAENGAPFTPLHQPIIQQDQRLSAEWRFCTAPMIDWTDQIFGVVFPQEFRR